MARGKARDLEVKIDPEVTTTEPAEGIIPEVPAAPEAPVEPATPVIEPEAPEASVEPESHEAQPEREEPETVIEPEASIEPEGIEDPVVEAEPEAPEAPAEDIIASHANEKLTIKGLAKPYKTDADPIGSKAISGDVYVVDGEISRGRIRVFQAGGPVVWINVDDLDDGE